MTEVTMFRRFLTAGATAALLVTALALPVAAGGPSCVDIQSTNADGTQNSRAAFDGETGEVMGQFFLAGASCTQFSYRLVVLDNEGDATPIASASVRGDKGAAAVIITVSGVSVDDGDVCVYVESATGNGNHVFDRAPGDGCVILFDDGSSPAGGKGF
jgi:hypothetical protein